MPCRMKDSELELYWSQQAQSVMVYMFEIFINVRNVLNIFDIFILLCKAKEKYTRILYTVIFL